MWGLIGGATAVANEYWYRTLPGDWWHYIHLWVPTQLLISFAIYKIVTTPNVNLLDALIVFTFSTLMCRIFVSVWMLDDKIGPATWVAFGLLVAARVVQVVWK